MVVVEGDFVGSDDPQLRVEAAKYAHAVRQALQAVGVAFETSRDSTVEKWGLPASCRVALLPYNRAVSAEERAQVRAFVGRGGNLIIFYVGPEELLLECGVRAGEVVSAEGPDQFALLRLTPGALPLLPEAVGQSSWNVRRCEPLPGAAVLGTWADVEGHDSGLPAVVLGPRGAFISHVFVGGDDYRKGRLLRALIGHFVPELWPAFARAELAQLDALGRFGSLDRMAEYLRHRREAGHRVDVPLAAAERALALRQNSRRALADDSPTAAVEAASTARVAASRAFYACYPSKPGELRGAWMTFRGVPTWDDTMRRLREANFNAVMPRLCSAGVAYFPSRYLPEAAYSREHGDQLAGAAAAGVKHGVAVHARTVALFVYEPPPGVREAYARAGRLMVSASGETTDWLCPSDPANRAAVVGACLEMASRYPIAGVQLDYTRYPARAFCYCRTCKAKFERDLGLRVARWPFDCLEGQYRGRFADWRREQITSLVREIALRVRDARTGCQVSADVFVDWERHRDALGQDWKAWVDEGLVDFVCPMDYTADDEQFASWVTRQRRWVGDQAPLCPGIGPSVEGCNLTPEHVLRQIELSRHLGGDGFVLFEYDDALAAEHLPVIASGLTGEPSAFSVGPPYLRCEATPTNEGAALSAVLTTASARTPRAPARREDGPPATLLDVPGVVVNSADLKLYTADAWPVLDLGPIAPERRLTRDLRLAAGSYRLCALGSLARAGAAAPEPFVRWGLPFEVSPDGRM